MRDRISVGLVLAMCVLAITAGCARPLKEQVQGRWKQVNGSWEITFLKDGTVSTTVGGPLQINGAYTTPDERHVKIEPSGFLGTLAGSQVWQARTKDGRLILTINGQPEEFQRVQP